jgi:transposase-like protein
MSVVGGGNGTSLPTSRKKRRISALGENPQKWDSKRGIAPGAGKEIVMSLVQRGGKVRSMHMQRVTSENLRPIMKEYLAEGTHVMTDSSAALKSTKKDGWKHDKVNHTEGEYVRYENGVCISTNTVEGYFSLLKRGINGVYHHVGKQHLHRYLSEFDFRYNARDVDDIKRAEMALDGTNGKRLFYRDSSLSKRD